MALTYPGSDEESEDDSDDESDWSESEEESDSEMGGYDLDVCPQGCDQGLYDNTCSLREKRLDIEEGLTEEKKNRDSMNKELDGLQKKAKVIDMALKNAENELEAFQVGPLGFTGWYSGTCLERPSHEPYKCGL